MTETRPGGKWLFSESVQALRGLKSRFEALDRDAHELTVRLLYRQTPPPCEPETPRNRKLTDRGEWVWCLPGEKPNDVIPESIEEKASGLCEGWGGMLFDVVGVNLGPGPYRASWEAKTGQAGLIPCQRRFIASGNPDEVRRLLSIANDSAALIANVIEAASASEARASLWPDVPTDVELAPHAGYWVDLVFEVGRWRLPSVPFRCQADTPETIITEFTGFPGQAGDPLLIEAVNRRHAEKRSLLARWKIDPTATDFWTKLDQPPYKQMTLAGFAAKSAAVIELLIQWGETGVNPFQSRVDAQRSPRTTTLPADYKREMARLDTDLQVLKSSNPIHERLKTAYGYWGTYPLQRELLVDSPRREATDEHVVSETYLVLLKLDEVHKAAVDVLMSRSKEQGGNPTLIWKSANYCRELLADYQKTHNAYPVNRESDYWPECLGPTLFELPADIRQAIQDGNAEVRTLCVPQERLIDALPKLTGEEQPEVIGEPTPDTLATTIEAGLRNRIHIVKADSPEMMAFDQEFEELSGIAYPPKNVGEWMTVLILARFDQTWIDKAMCTFGEPGFEDCGELPRPYVSTGGVTMGDAPATLEERQAKFGSPQFTPVLMMRLRQYATENANARKSKTPVGQSKGDAEAGGGKSKTDDKNNAVSRVVGVYNWAISEISGADAMTIKELFNAIQIHPSMKSEFLEKLPNNPETFGTYLRRGGIERYNVSGDRQHRPSRRPKKH